MRRCQRRTEMETSRRCWRSRQTRGRYAQGVFARQQAVRAFGGATQRDDTLLERSTTGARQRASGLWVAASHGQRPRQARPSPGRALRKNLPYSRAVVYQGQFTWVKAAHRDHARFWNGKAVEERRAPTVRSGSTTPRRPPPTARSSGVATEGHVISPGPSAGPASTTTATDTQRGASGAACSQYPGRSLFGGRQELRRPDDGALPRERSGDREGEQHGRCGQESGGSHLDVGPMSGTATAGSRVAGARRGCGIEYRHARCTSCHPEETMGGQAS